jgi:hypothetical protein
MPVRSDEGCVQAVRQRCVCFPGSGIIATAGQEQGRQYQGNGKEGSLGRASIRFHHRIPFGRLLESQKYAVIERAAPFRIGEARNRWVNGLSDLELTRISGIIPGFKTFQ